KLLRGVMHRVDDLGDRKFGYKPKRAVPFKSIIQLEEIIAETLTVGAGSKKVQTMYEAMTAHMSEFELLLDATSEQIAKYSSTVIAENVLRVRRREVHIVPGYDGLFGKIQIYTPEGRE
nr:endonuclease Q family protein [bacterium]